MLKAPKSEYNKSLSLAYPVMIGSLGQILVGTADSIMVGQTGPIPLAAISFANSLLAIPLVFGIGIAYGLTPLVANADGSGNVRKASRLFKNGLFVNVAIGLLIVGILLGIRPFMDQLGQDPAVVKEALKYYTLVALSFFPLQIFFQYKQFTEGISDTKAAMRLSLTANALNIVLNYILIYGKLGFEPMGIEGASWATLISRIIMMFLMVYWVHYRPKYKQYMSLFLETKVKWKDMRSVLEIGIPSGLQYIFEVGAFASASLIIGAIGALDQAAHQIAISLASISYMAASGFGAAATVRVGNQLGRRDVATLKVAAKTLFEMTVIFMGAAGVIYLFGRDWLPTFFTDEMDVITIAADLLIITTIFQISDGVQVTALGALRGLGDVKIPTLITFVSYWVIAIPLGYVLGNFTELKAIGVWIGLATGLTISALFQWVRFQSKVKKLHFSQE
ncbi:MAG: MATE family efflux transporter [Flavobacteriia bacterium]|nr:MATE family efflux transporter [Flavobacteriia bacterium]